MGAISIYSVYGLVGEAEASRRAIQQFQKHNDLTARDSNHSAAKTNTHVKVAFVLL